MKSRGRSKGAVRLRVVVFQQDGVLCAQCIDYDLIAQAATLSALYRAFHRLVVGHMAIRRRHGQEPFKGLPPADEKYRLMFAQSKIELPHQIFSFETSGAARSLPPPTIRVAVPA